MKTIVKPAISWINTDSDALLINDSQTILTAMDDNPSYLTPVPDLNSVNAAVGEFSTAVANAADGGTALTAIKKAKRKVLAGLLRNLANYVEVTCAGDLAVLLTSGFPIQKPQRTPIGILPAPQNLTVTHGALAHTLATGVNPVFGAATYNWTCTPNTPGAVPLTGQSTAASFTFTGLTPGVSYTITANAVGAAGPGNWSSPVSLIAV